MTIIETLQDVILNSPLYKKASLDRQIKCQKLTQLPAMNFFCNGECQSSQTFKLTSINNQRLNNYYNNNLPVDNCSFLLEQTCQKCDEYSVHHAVHFYPSENENGDAISVIQKIGQLPSYEDTLDKELESWLMEDDAELYKKGLRCEANSFGIGSYGYFRRILENNIEKLLDDIAATNDSPELMEAIELAKKKHNAKDRLEIIKENAPKSLMPNGQNILKILYKALSEGIHNQTDEQCLNRAINIRTCLGYLIKKINRDRVSQEEFNIAIVKVAKKPKKLVKQ